MVLVLMVIGAVIGSWLGSAGEEMLGILGGATVGYLLARLRRLEETLDEQKKRLEKLRATPASPPAAAEPPSPAREQPALRPEPAGARRSETPLRAPVAGTETARPAASRSSRPAEPGPAAELVDRAWQALRRWITTGNVPVKVGVIISFFGVAFLLKYAVDRELLSFPIEFRLAAIAVGALAMLATGWRLRQRERVYALSLVGGAIGILYLVIFAALRLYDLLPAALAFLLLVLLTVAVGALAVLLNARSLAILATVGGFLAPVLTSTGQGSHVALFSYYLLLNAAILGISWFRAWRVLNLLGFLFTFGIGTAWGYQYYRPEFYASTQPFLLLYFLFYQAIAVLFAFRQAPKLRGLVDGSILFGTPVIAFALQAELVGDTEYGLALSAAVVAVFYTVLAAWLAGRDREQFRLMVESFVALGVAFATITVPLALDARWTAAAWALEGAALVWVGVRQSGLLARLAGIALLFASGGAFIEAGWNDGVGIAVLNGNFLGGLLISAAALYASFLLDRDGRPLPGQQWAARALLLWSLCWWALTGAAEAQDRLASPTDMHAFLLFFAGSAACLALLARALRWHMARLATLAYLPLLVVVGLLYLIVEGHWFAGLGALSWSAAIASHFFILYCLGTDDDPQPAAWHLGGVLLLAAGLAIEAGWRVDQAGLGSTWSSAAAMLVLLLLAAALPALRERLRWPFTAQAAAYTSAAGLLLGAQLCLLTLAMVESPGDPAPLPYLPVLNPFDILTLAGLLLAYRFLLAPELQAVALPGGFRARALQVLAALAFLLTTIAVVRAVYHFGDIAWSGRSLSASVSVQAALSIYWGVLGFAGMLAGARLGRRLLWLIGTGLMALVVIKLFLVDLGNTGTVARIVSFLGVGVLLLVVGYFAPAPPRLLTDGERKEA